MHCIQGYLLFTMGFGASFQLNISLNCMYCLMLNLLVWLFDSFHWEHKALTISEVCNRQLCHDYEVNQGPLQ